MCQHVTYYTGKGQPQALQAGKSLCVDVSDLKYQQIKVPRGFIAFSNSGRALRFCNQSSRRALGGNLYFFFLLGFLAIFPLPLPLPLPPCLAK